jgi:V/A-type H+-transporting ATPase subunit I
MALTPAKMKRVDMVILERDVRMVTKLLGRLGVLHLVKVRTEETGARLVLVNRTDDLNRCRAQQNRLNAIREHIGLREIPFAGEEDHRPMDVVEQEVAGIETVVNPLVQLRAKIEAESERIQDELLRLEALGIFHVPLARLLESPFLHFAVGTIKGSDLSRLEDEARENILLLAQPGSEDRQNLVAVTSKKGRFALESLLRKHGLDRIEITELSSRTPAEIVQGLMKRLDEIRAEQKRISEGLRGIGAEDGSRIAALYRRIELEIALLEASMNFGHTSATCLISGWLPADYVAVVSERLLKETEGRIVINIQEAETSNTPMDEVPVLMKNHPLIRPFELLVQGFGYPRYKEIEPTIIVALSFLLMYGLMFGDVGHGAILVLGGLWFWLKGKSSQTRNIGYIVTAAGVFAILGGFLYGSVFGMEKLRALFARPMEDVMIVLTVPVALGVVLVSLGVVLNIINRIRTGDYLHGIIDRFGVVGIVFYWGAVGLGVRYALLGHGIKTWQVVLFIAIPLVILFFRELIFHWLSPKGEAGEGGFAGLMHGGIDVMETLSSYLANTVSFARVGAFALAHAGLCAAVFSLEEIVRELPAGPVWAVLVLVFGNALIIGLEGLVVFIQCLRLEYYEFFGKFYGGSGKRYSPFQIR